MGRAATLELSLAERFKKETSDDHKAAEGHPFISALFREELTHVQYFAHIVDLHLVYDAMERSIRSSLSKEPRLQSLHFKGLEREHALQEDIEAKEFTGLVQNPSQQAKSYAAHLRALAETYPLLLIAHAYVRYLGDLSGGMMLKRHIESQWPDAAHFYNFDKLLKECSLDRPAAFKDLFKERLTALSLTPKEQSDLVSEARKAFTLSGKLFDAIIPR